MSFEHPLAEVFGFPPDNFSKTAEHYWINRLCSYKNKVPSCTKDKALDTLDKYQKAVSPLGAD